MKLHLLGRLAAVLALTGSLAACVDMTAEVEVNSETTGRVTSVVTMSAEFYGMAKELEAMAESNPDMKMEKGFCAAEGDELVENADGSATCTSVHEGNLSDLKISEDANQNATSTVVSPGVVRVGMKLDGAAAAEAAAGPGGMSAEDKAGMDMMMATFAGHTATFRIKGKKIVDTNMTLNADGTMAESVIPLDKLMQSDSGLPPELYAVVDTN